MNKKLFAAICVVIAIIPVCIAVGSYIYAHNQPVDIKSVTNMSLITPDGNSYSFDKSTKSSSTSLEEPIIDFFLNMNKSAKKESSLPEPLKSHNYYSASYKSYDMETPYKYYFTEDPNYAYFVNEKNEAFRIASSYAEKFLELEYASSIFPNSIPPTMSISGSQVKPESMSWKYVLNGNDFKDSANISLAESVDTYEVVAHLNPEFTIKPDYLFVTIVKNGNTVFDDLYENLSPDLFQTNANLQITISAKWIQTTDSKYYGEAVYRFDANVLSKPVFYANRTNVQPGDFVMISGKNVIDISSVTFSSEPSINFTPTFYKDGEYATALVPISYELPDASSYTFTITSGEVTQTVVINITPKTFLKQDNAIPAKTISSYRSESALSEFEQTIVPILKQSSDTKYWDGVFIEGSEPGRSIKTGFGLHVNLSAVGTQIRHEGVEYLVKQGDGAYAVNNGKVIYTGDLKLTGKVVIVDHGYGLKSLYAHLDNISVNVGDELAKGDLIGIVGATGFTSGVSLHVGLYVSDVPVCPYPLWENGIITPEY